MGINADLGIASDRVGGVRRGSSARRGVDRSADRRRSDTVAPVSMSSEVTMSEIDRDRDLRVSSQNGHAALDVGKSTLQRCGPRPYAGRPMELPLPPLSAGLAAPLLLIVWSVATIAYTALRASRR